MNYNLRQRLIRWLRFDVSERWCIVCERHDWADPVWEWVDKPANLLCRMLHAHVVIEDHCGNPEHRLCAWCMKPMPNAPVHGGRS